MARITVKIEGLGKNFAKTQAEIIQRLSNIQLEAIARKTEEVIKAKITERIERDGSTGNLANSFTTVKITGGWGVGDIDFLNKQAPYWYWQNFGIAQSGRKIPPGSKGAFKSGNPRPTAGAGGSRWGSNGQFFINPKKPIEAKNYIQATLNEVNQIVASVIRTIKL